jgi:hypothetical protein
MVPFVSSLQMLASLLHPLSTGPEKDCLSIDPESVPAISTRPKKRGKKKNREDRGVRKRDAVNQSDA